MRVAVALIASFACTAVHAQSVDDPDKPAQSAAPQASNARSDSDGPATTAALPSASETPDRHRFDRFEKLGIKGWDTPFPRMSDTMLQNAGGVRSALADAGIGFLAFSLNSGVYNVRHDDTPGASYNGRRPTYFAGSQALYVTFDTGKLGVPNGQLQFQGGINTNGLSKIDGPRFARIGGLSYFQQLWNDRVEFKIGYFSLAPEFVGTQVAGSLVAGTLGPQAGIPVQLGFSYSGLGAPAADLRVNGDDGLYGKVGIQRSFPRGGVNEVIEKDKVGLRFSYPGAKPLFVGEVGINRKSAPDHKSMWVRGGMIYNTTRFINYRDGGTSQNWAAFLAADRQLTQSDPEQPARGIYGGASFNYAPPDRNRYTQYYEGRVYGIGLIHGRPADLASLVLSYNKLSKRVLDASYIDQNAAAYAFSAIASYSYRLIRGMYVQPGIGLVKNPLPATQTPLAVNGYLTVSFLL